MTALAPLTGGPLAVDLVNTLPHTPQGDIDLLATPAEFQAWWEIEANRLPAGSDARTGDISEGDLTAVHAVRLDASLAIRAAILGEAPPGTALAGLNRILRKAPAIRELSWGDTSVIATTRHPGASSTIAAVLAEATADLLTGSAITRLRNCEAEGCVLLFLPANPRRRWCSATLCGNRARTARYYRRHNRS